jgi:hypothetical protein
MRSPNQPSFVRHIDGAGYGNNDKQYTHDEDGALEEAEVEIRRLKMRVVELEAHNARLITQIKELKGKRPNEQR